MAAERDEKGKPRWSQLAIAQALGVGETTVFRVLKGAGAYGTLPEPKTDEEAVLSAQRFREEHPELFTAEGKMIAAVQKERTQRETAEQTVTELLNPELAKEKGYL